MCLWLVALAAVAAVGSAGNCNACGYNCDANCNCGRCNTKPGCMNNASCLGPCNGGGNAKWCGGSGPVPPPPPPPPPPSPPPPPPPAVTWSTSRNAVQKNGVEVVLHGLGTTCTEYLLRGVGMDCFTAYNWADPAHLLQVNTTAIQNIVNVLTAAASPTVTPIVRIPMTASYWLNVSTKASAGNMAKYPGLSAQYQAFIGQLVKTYTDAGIVAIADLHWADDDGEQQPMAGKTTANCVTFWDSVASTFGDNPLVFYELYNEPHTTVDQWMNGDAKTAGMLEMLAAVRKHTTNPAIIAGSAGYAYDSMSLVQLDAKLKAAGDSNVIYNFHPYMGPAQAGAMDKCADGFEQHVFRILNSTDKPIIITEFGQACCPTDGACESCPATFNGTVMGYDQSLLTIATKNGVSWLPWAWRPGAGGMNTGTCEDLNGGGTPPGTGLAHPTNGKGGDFLTLWNTFVHAGGPPTPPAPPGPGPSPSGCPGGSLTACINLCPASPPAAYEACVEDCGKRCTNLAYE